MTSRLGRSLFGLRRPFGLRQRPKPEEFSKGYRAARSRDRDSIHSDLDANEEPPVFPSFQKTRPGFLSPTPPPPESPAVRQPPPLIPGWRFVESMRTLYQPRNLPRELTSLWQMVDFELDYNTDQPRTSYMYITTDGVIRVQPHKRAIYEKWYFTTLHLIYHLALGYVDPPPDCEDVDLWVMACEMVVNQHVTVTAGLVPPRGFQAISPVSRFSPFRFGRPAPGNQTEPIPTANQLLKKWREEGLPPLPEQWRTSAGPLTWDVLVTTTSSLVNFRSAYALDKVKSLAPNIRAREPYFDTPPARAIQWFKDNFPLLSAAAAEFSIDYENADKFDVNIAAVDANNQIIFVNLEADMTELEWRFVMAHEILHVVLEHQKRKGNRDAFVWNIACDYVINNWLVQMGVGTLPPRGGLYKEEYAGLDSETIYDQLIENGGNDQLTFRGKGLGDLLDLDPDYQPGNGQIRRRFPFRTTVRQHTQNAARRMMEDQGNGLGRGYLPGGLIEELDLRAVAEELVQVPEWKAELAEWFNLQFTPKPPRRSYARISRRQSSTPDIPRPGMSPLELHSPTFGVILDTSGSMSHELLQKGLSAVVAFSERHGVRRVRFVMCDTQPYDEGFIPVEDLKKPYRIWGRGGTILQPSVDLLLNAKDFPKEAPILIVTDGEIDVLSVDREHAFLLPGDGKLPFEPQGPVFRVLGDNRGGSPFRRRFPAPPARPPASQNYRHVQRLIDHIKKL